jgi:hypothetical protein
LVQGGCQSTKVVYTSVAAPVATVETHQKASLDSLLASSEPTSLVPLRSPPYPLRSRQTAQTQIQEPSSSIISNAFVEQLTLAGDLDHIGIRFSSVNNPQISSALACNVALTSTVAVFPTLDPEPEATGLSALVSVSVLAGGAGA